MENKANVIIELGLQRDEENGDVAAFAFDLPKGVAERVCLEQEKCELLCEGGRFQGCLMPMRYSMDMSARGLFRRG